MIDMTTGKPVQPKVRKYGFTDAMRRDMEAAFSRSPVSISDLSVLHLEVGDTLVVRVSGLLPHAAHEHLLSLHSRLRDWLNKTGHPDVDLLFLDSNTDLQILPSAAAQHATTR